MDVYHKVVCCCDTLNNKHHDQHHDQHTHLQKLLSSRAAQIFVSLFAQLAQGSGIDLCKGDAPDDTVEQGAAGLGALPCQEDWLFGQHELPLGSVETGTRPNTWQGYVGACYAQQTMCFLQKYTVL